ncbi:hypothetical protein HYW76_02385 [Candidatus Pacearchaeota archaeon]|nr:hypothetical protein [Candidatus Pacearchaeota archaeon]
MGTRKLFGGLAVLAGLGITLMGCANSGKSETGVYVAQPSTSIGEYNVEDFRKYFNVPGGRERERKTRKEFRNRE